MMYPNNVIIRDPDLLGKVNSVGKALHDLKHVSEPHALITVCFVSKYLRVTYSLVAQPPRFAAHEDFSPDELLAITDAEQFVLLLLSRLIRKVTQVQLDWLELPPIH